MNYIIIAFAVITFVSTLIGGSIAIKHRKVLHYFFAFAAGTLISVTFFDLLPESLEISSAAGLPVRYIMIAIVGAFLFYSFIERYFLTHHHHEEHGHKMGPVGAGGLVVHSFFDGIAIGSAFQINASIGIIVALAVIFHDFTDGINTVTIMLKNKQHVEKAKMFLIADALAPIIGIFAVSAFTLQPALLALILAAFCGEFLYIGTTNLLPETYKHDVWRMGAVMVLGILLIFGLTSLI